jgi:hypothetical protein
VGWGSTVLILVLAFGVLLSFLYTSSLIQIDRSNDFYRVLGSKKIDASLFRLVSPETICFSLQDKDLKQFGFLPVLMEQADSFVSDQAPSIHDNRYDGFGMPVNATDALPLIRAFEIKFNHTVDNKVIRGYHDETHLYSCNFEYNDKQYYLRLEFRSLTALDDYSGFVPISVTKKGVLATVSSARLPDNMHLNNFRTINNPSDMKVFQTFNNTLVWTNNLNDDYNILSSGASSWVKLTLNSAGFEGQKVTLSTEIPPGKSWDYRLSHNYESLGPTVYEYFIEGERIGTVHGTVTVNFYPVPCMNPQEARSLYGQSGFNIRFPSYLPDGYDYKCGIQYDHFMLKEIYWNRTTGNLDDLAIYLSNNSEESALHDGMIQVFAVKAVSFWHDNANVTAQDRLKELTNGELSTYYLEPKLIEIGHYDDNDKISRSEIEAVAYQRNLYNWKDINILEVYDHDRQEAYIFKGKVSLEELVKMAQSMYLP